MRCICAMGIGAIIILESLALYKGVNGAGLGVAFAAIGGMVGYAGKWVFESLKKRKCD